MLSEPRNQRKQMLINDFYSILSQRQEEDTTVFEVALREDCQVYKGHFPDEPVSPGVCNIEMVKECAEQIVGKKLMINYIHQCRMTRLITPKDCPTLDVRVKIEEDELVASINKGEDVYLTIKGTVQEKK